MLTNTPFENPEFRVEIRDAAIEDRLVAVMVVVVPAADLAMLERATFGVTAVPVRAPAIDVADGLAADSEREVMVLEPALLAMEDLEVGIRPAVVMSRRASGRDEDESVLLVVDGDAALMEEDGARADATLPGWEAVADGTVVLDAGAADDRMLLQGETWVGRDVLWVFTPALLPLLAATPVPWPVVAGPALGLPREGVVICGLADAPGVTARDLAACDAPGEDRGA